MKVFCITKPGINFGLKFFLQYIATPPPFDVFSVLTPQKCGGGDLFFYVKHPFNKFMIFDGNVENKNFAGEIMEIFHTIHYTDYRGFHYIKISKYISYGKFQRISNLNPSSNTKD